mmetsp:Transcript_21449/g.61205  ORF Transcript_21449/g.61205 Transcript_21449/m.61205 type:complete len:270 (+) Transcript_21449:1092-1901(+)
MQRLRWLRVLSALDALRDGVPHRAHGQAAELEVRGETGCRGLPRLPGTAGRRGFRLLEAAHVLRVAASGGQTAESLALATEEQASDVAGGVAVELGELGHREAVDGQGRQLRHRQGLRDGAGGLDEGLDARHRDRRLETGGGDGAVQVQDRVPDEGLHRDLETQGQGLDARVALAGVGLRIPLPVQGPELEGALALEDLAEDILGRPPEDEQATTVGLPELRVEIPQGLEQEAEPVRADAASVEGRVQDEERDHPSAILRRPDQGRIVM